MKLTLLLNLGALAFVAGFTSPQPRINGGSVNTALAAEGGPSLLDRVFKRNADTDSASDAVSSRSNMPASPVEPEQLNRIMKDDECDVPEEKNELQKMLDQVKDAGVAGSISLFLWELAFWAISIPVAIVGYTQVTGSFPDFSNQDDLAKVGAEAFAFANVARLALPARIALAVATIPWVQENIVDRFMKDEDECDPSA